MRRRGFITLVGGAAAWLLAARAQQPAMPVVGFIGSTTTSAETHLFEAFRKGLAEVGFVVGQNVAIEYHSAEGQYDRLPAMAADLVGRKVAIIAASGPPAALEAKRSTATIPIVFVIGYDPIEYGLVASLNRPGGNITGATFFGGALVPKRLELALELVPYSTKIGMLLNPNSPTSKTQVRDFQTAAHKLGREVYALNASLESDLEPAFAALIKQGVTSLLIGGDAFLMSRREKLVSLAAQFSLPTIYDRDEYVEAGGLMSYGTSLADSYRKVGIYAGRILKGEKPADLPVQQATKFELAINLKAAKALGIMVPPALIARADKVIE